MRDVTHSTPIAQETTQAKAEDTPAVRAGAVQRLLRWLQRWAPPLLVTVALALMALLISSQWQEIRDYQWRISPGWLAISAVCMLAAWGLEIQIWRGLLRLLDASLPFLAAMRIWFLSAVVRYIPGNIWQPLSMTLYAQKHSVRPEATLTSYLLYQIVLLLAAMPLAAIYFLLSGNWGVLSGWVGDATGWLAAAILLPVAGFLVMPAWLMAVINWLLVKVGRPPIGTRLSRINLLVLLLLCMANWLLWGATFATLAFGVSAFTPEEIGALFPHLALTYPLAYTIGFLSLITPSGLGVREGALLVLLSPMLAGSVVTIISLAMRLWNIVGEVVMALIAVAIPDPVAREWDRARAAEALPRAEADL